MHQPRYVKMASPFGPVLSRHDLMPSDRQEQRQDLLEVEREMIVKIALDLCQ